MRATIYLLLVATAVASVAANHNEYRAAIFKVNKICNTEEAAKLCTPGMYPRVANSHPRMRKVKKRA